MKRLRAGLVLLVVAAVLLVSARMTLRAQERKAPTPKPAGARPSDRKPLPLNNDGEATASIQDALQRPFTFPFAEPTTLADVCQFLRQALKAPVVLDLAALERESLKPDDHVQLELEGVRLKTGLKLLLDQVGLTFQVVAEDNLLILTDAEGATDPVVRILSELKSLHRDVHDLQDAVDDLSWSLGMDEDSKDATIRKPTIVDEFLGKDRSMGRRPTPLPGSPDLGTRARPGA